MSVRGPIILLLTLQVFTTYAYAAQFNVLVLVACHHRCSTLSSSADLNKCMADCVKVSDDAIGDNNVGSIMSPETLSAILENRRLNSRWTSSANRQPEMTTHEEAFINQKRLSLSPRAASLVGSGMAHQYLRIGRSFGGAENQAELSSPLENEAGVVAEEAGSRYPIERRNVNTLTGTRLASAAKSYLRVGKKAAESPEAPRS